MPYYASPSSYLKRARARLDCETHEALFYAAFELRCGIEARMRRYLDAQGTISRLRKRGWRIAQMAAQLRNAPMAEQACHMEVLDSSGQKHTDFFYIPVSSELKKMAERLGDYLHFLRRPYDDEDPWWQRTREYLESVHRELEYVCRGNLMGVPLINPKTNNIHMEFEQPMSDAENIDLLGQAFREQQKVQCRVQYFPRGRRISFKSRGPT